ncbi:MAG: ABC transporter substrate-binding protein [Erysipelotrichia bacterium]|nr:ABC transporter substrate-binding protein [Erysipelotrichia bacterium]
MKNIIQLLLLLSLIFSCTGCQKEDNKQQFNIYSLTGPTSMGSVKLYNDDKDQKYHSHIVSDGSEITSALINENADIAMLPANLAAILYNKNPNFKVVAINTLGVLYIVENGNTIQSIDDLHGKTIVLTGQGTTPEYVLKYLLNSANISDVDLIFKSSANEVAATLASGLADIALLPQPFVSVALSKNANLRIALNLSEQWNKYTDGQQLITAVTVVRNEILEKYPEDIKQFLNSYRESIEWVNQNNADAAKLIVQANILNDQLIAQNSLPFCNLVYIDGQEMKYLLENYLKVLYDADPSSIGMNLPDENFYFYN